MAESVKNAFSVQRDVPVLEIPVGTSIIAQHFSPAPTEPAPLEEVKQSVEQRTPTLGSPERRAAQLEALQLQVEELKALIVQAKQRDIEQAANHIRAALAQEIEVGLVSVETKDLDIIIRINETGSFASGSAVLKDDFAPVMKKIAVSIGLLPGKILIVGHTDSVPIATENYRSNWELSASRAVTVAHYLLQGYGIEPARVEVEGHADTRSLAPNDSEVNKAKNCRVEIGLPQ